MSTVYLVSYDLHSKGQNYADLIAELKNSYEWAKALESTWLIHTDESATTLYDRLRKHIDDNDRILVIEVTANYTGWLPKDIWEWMRVRVKSRSLSY